MALLSRTERKLLQMYLREPHLTDEQYGSLVRELQRDDWSVCEDPKSVDLKLGIARKP